VNGRNDEPNDEDVDNSKLHPIIWNRPQLDTRTTEVNIIYDSLTSYRMIYSSGALVTLHSVEWL